MNKKGSIIDVGFLIVLAIGFSIFLVIVGYVYFSISAELRNSVIGEDENAIYSLSILERAIYNFDYLFVMIFIGISIAVLISSSQIETKPIFIPFYILSLMLLIIFGAVGQNVWENISIVPQFIDQVTNKPMTNYLMNHLIITSIGIGVLSMILIFAKPKGVPY